MNAHTTFERESARGKRHSKGAPVPLAQRPWFRFAAWATIGGWLLVCMFGATLLAN